MRSAVPDLEWKATAIADLLAIIDYISDDNPDAAQALKDEIEDKTSRLPEHPQMYRVGRLFPIHSDKGPLGTQKVQRGLFVL